MTDRPVTESSSTETPQPPTKHPVSSGLDASRLIGYAALAIAVVAAIFAGLAYFHPAHNKPSAIQQSGDAKANVCSAYKAAHSSVVINTHMQSPNPNDQVAELAVATNARLALIGGGAYLKDRLDANTGAPSDLANAADSFANTIEQLGTNYLVGAGPEAQDPLRHDLDTQIQQLNKLCS